MLVHSCVMILFDRRFPESLSTGGDMGVSRTASIAAISRPAQQLTASADPQPARLLPISPDSGDVGGRIDMQASTVAGHVVP